MQFERRLPRKFIKRVNETDLSFISTIEIFFITNVYHTGSRSRHCVIQQENRRFVCYFKQKLFTSKN